MEAIMIDDKYLENPRKVGQTTFYSFAKDAPIFSEGPTMYTAPPGHASKKPKEQDTE
jgi:hypothetical protein